VAAVENECHGASRPALTFGYLAGRHLAQGDAASRAIKETAS
jgi:hypothetical protein